MAPQPSPPSAPFMPQRYIAQGAYTQRNPFRVQNFEEFAANPIYAKPPGFHAYADCKMYNFESARATQGEFLLQRLADATNPMSAEERESTAKFLNSVVDKLQAGEWFFKWSGRKDKVYQRYFWVNLQRGTLMWSFSPDKVSFFNAEVKLLTVTQVVPDCIQDGSTNRTFYRIRVESPEKSVCMSTEIRGKFDVWYRALKDLTASNADSGVPGIWGRPSCSINFTAGGTMSRWASRYSPLQAVVDSANEELGGISVRPNCRVASSD
ncbi:hypothetical protein AGDE_14948 [Angomonas deanei]|uniref:Meiotic cell cortex C-terminal pleckstrin homology, putative n=1 Tax=Angomonas deanei TaxID=59799 RepID=A0A7G2C7N0_9TRYP|nr:hypothetical protein AGDE_14948 [Angomonas deanei]CAD2215830.1 Meiotic cell cortex C-terminal pleckstrin homology, putative [Angomonas deanei]|eukprot:EPY19940.1 hypothetical protein AGDE_14948 [Angomonas deanei]